MIMTVRWRSVVLMGILSIASLLCLYCWWYHPSNNILTSLHSRRLQEEDLCKELEGEIEKMHDLIHAKEKINQETMEILRQKNSATWKKLESQTNKVKILEDTNRELIKMMSGMDPMSIKDQNADLIAPRITPNSLRLMNIHQHSEFEVLPFVTFSRDRVYDLDTGMINKPERAPIGNRKLEFEAVLEESLQSLNFDRKWNLYGKNDLIHGYYRTDPNVGTQYELFYTSKNGEDHIEHVQLFRPFAPIQEVNVNSYAKTKDRINLIITLSGRLKTFEIFLVMFTEQCIMLDKRVHLTVVYFEDGDMEQARNMLEKLAEEHDFESYTFIEKQGPFSRGVGLVAGADAWKEGNVIFFFCDVDVVIKPGFLDRCRMNTESMVKVYYPIVFSLYNPAIVYEDYDTTPFWEDQLYLKQQNGFWRTFGFGMTCMYRLDFLFMRGFDTNIQGWGMEDVKLYKKFALSNFNVIRAPDPGIFHLWHEKFCDPNLSKEQYDMCLGSKALGEASHEQMGKLAFRKMQEETNDKQWHGEGDDVAKKAEVQKGEYLMKMDDDDVGEEFIADEQYLYGHQ